ncbi:MAG: transporter substrate-binding domain-containing protein [Clostridia bacterium]|nr:transporter substrate-binding domain-containing protein [Clostridia bacterium]
MKTQRPKDNLITRITAAFVCMIILTAIFLPASVFSKAETPAKIRVGWYQSPFNTIDELGRRSGYAYEYEQKIAAYTGWDYEYVTGTWTGLMKMLENGEIDLMSDVSYVADRTEHMLYPTLPMGTETYYIYVPLGSDDVKSDDYSSLNGKTLGVTENSVQQQIFTDWAAKHGVTATLEPLGGSEDQSIQLMLEGRVDAVITTDSYGDADKIAPVFKIGSSDIYFVVNKDREDLLSQLNYALSRIQDENRYYNEQLFEKYLRQSGTELFINAEEKAWLLDHGVIRVGYQDNYLAFCASDEKGQLTGALKDYLTYASIALENATLQFETVAYPTAAAAMQALRNGEVDCMFPANFTDHDSETQGVVMSPALMRTEMDAVVRASDRKEFVIKQDVTVAVNEGNPNYDLFLIDHYPGWKTVHYVDTPTCLEAVAAGKADCVIISNYRFSNISKQCEKLRLTTVYTGVDMDYCLAIRKGDTTLYSLMSRVINAVPSSVVNTALTYYSTEDAKTGFVDFIKDNLIVVLIIVAIVVLIILILLLNSIRANKKVAEEEHLVENLNKRIYVDALTSVKNKGSFYANIQKLQDGIARGEKKKFAIGVFDCDELKKINDKYGHDKGDEYLKTAAKTIRDIFINSDVFRIGGDEFAVILLDEDYENRDELLSKFETAQTDSVKLASNDWDRVSVAVGIAVYDPNTDDSVNDTARRADKIMYENKRLRKSARKADN